MAIHLSQTSLFINLSVVGECPICLQASSAGHELPKCEFLASMPILSPMLMHSAFGVSKHLYFHCNSPWFDDVCFKHFKTTQIEISFPIED